MDIEKFKKAMGVLLKEERIKQDIKVHILAVKVEITPSALHRIESGQVLTSTLTTLRLCRQLNIPISRIDSLLD